MVASVADGLPKPGSVGTLRLHQRGDPLGAARGQASLSISHQCSGQPSEPRINREAIQVRPPPVESRDQAAHDLAA